MTKSRTRKLTQENVSTQPTPPEVGTAKVKQEAKTKDVGLKEENTLELTALEKEKMQKLSQGIERIQQMETVLGRAIVDIELQKDQLKMVTIQHNKDVAEFEYGLQQAYGDNIKITPEGKVILPTEQQ